MNDIQKAVSLLNQGRLVAFPTETVYGLGADASNELAVREIFRAKERPYNHPLIVHLAHADQMKEWASDISPQAMQLANTFWPGPLTIILKKKSHVLDVVTGSQATVGLRVPNHPIALALLQAFGRGVVAPSANIFTHISPTTAIAVKEELGDRVDLILEGGACEVGLESTIIDMSGKIPVILRPGMISKEAIEKVLCTTVSSKRQDAPTVQAPGMHHHHYAPQTKTELVASDQLMQFIATNSVWPIALVVHNEFDIAASENIYLHTMPKDALAYAHTLYHSLRALDHLRLRKIVIEDVPKQADWEAIRDRLLKATTEK